jgi:hypothetical protein
LISLGARELETFGVSRMTIFRVLVPYLLDVDQNVEDFSVHLPEAASLLGCGQAGAFANLFGSGLAGLEHGNEGAGTPAACSSAVDLCRRSGAALHAPTSS